MAIIYKNSKNFRLYEDRYFDAPNWDETASCEVFSLNVKSYPFNFRRAGVDSDLARAFHKNGAALTWADTEEIASFAEKFINESGVSPAPASCIVIQNDCIAQVAIYKDKKLLETYNLELIFEQYSQPLTEIGPPGNSSLIPVGKLPANSVIYFPYPNIDNQTGEAIPTHKRRYAVVLPGDINIRPAVSNSQLAIKSTSKPRPNTIAVNQKDLDAAEPSSSLFSGTSHLRPECLCYIDNGYLVQQRGIIASDQKIDEIRKAVISCAKNREITAVAANGGVSRLNFPLTDKESKEAAAKTKQISNLSNKDNPNSKQPASDTAQDSNSSITTESFAFEFCSDAYSKRLVVLLG